MESQNTNVSFPQNSSNTHPNHWKGMMEDTTDSFLKAISLTQVKATYPASTIRTWKNRAIRGALSLDFMVKFLLENGFELKQQMIWTKPVEGPFLTASTFPVKTSKTTNHQPVDSKDGHLNIGDALFKVRKELYKDLVVEWQNWAIAAYAAEYPDRKQKLTPALFNQITQRRYISKENMVFAIKMLKEGRRILQNYKDEIARGMQEL